jgi:hypothetical protein
MKYFFYATLVITLAFCSGCKGKGGSVAVPNPKLLGCGSINCQQLWKDDYHASSTTYPRELVIDFKGNNPHGITAKYDKSASVDEIKEALDKDFAKSMFPSSNTPPVMIWRVEPENVVIQLTTTDDGAQQLTYLSLP